MSMVEYLAYFVSQSPWWLLSHYCYFLLFGVCLRHGLIPIFIILFSHKHKSCQNIEIIQCHVTDIISGDVLYLRNVGYFTYS